MTTLRLPAARARSGAIEESRGDKVFSRLNYIFLSIILILILYPLVYTVSASFSAPTAVMSGKVTLLPVEPTLIGYQKIFEHPALVKGMLNSLFYTIVGSAVSVVITVMAAYP